jgi:8-oxo-dGTP pyrophosphatase MutT (NUDIX family)
MAHRVLEPGDPALHSSDALDTAVAALRVLDDPARDEFVRFAGAHEDALMRTCISGHLTGSALVVDRGRQRMLLLHHRKLQKWLQPGGHADGDGNLAAVALREATEETGIPGLRVVVPAIHLDIHRVEPPNETPHLHYDVRYLVLAPADATAVGNFESTALRWVTLDELDAITDEPGLRLLARRGLAVADEVGQTSSGV